jgi:hypothetical protein
MQQISSQPFFFPKEKKSCMSHVVCHLEQVADKIQTNDDMQRMICSIVSKCKMIAYLLLCSNKIRGIEVMSLEIICACKANHGETWQHNVVAEYS